MGVFDNSDVINAMLTVLETEDSTQVALIAAIWAIAELIPNHSSVSTKEKVLSKFAKFASDPRFMSEEVMAQLSVAQIVVSGGKKSFSVMRPRSKATMKRSFISSSKKESGSSSYNIIQDHKSDHTQSHILSIKSSEDSNQHQNSSGQGLMNKRISSLTASGRSQSFRGKSLLDETKTLNYIRPNSFREIKPEEILGGKKDDMMITPRRPSSGSEFKKVPSFRTKLLQEEMNKNQLNSKS
eukprot:CAMPEP_0182433212 /NCGR_PEP_ID=MMETSP1167-20130531/61668_1 /TAXON_ID=2988 /ORGANISM="Mallomonas Sp, Strain CCMP3275" /LENGTH=239 /DNA_ID=CAMNT_0024621625 /DNA_START=468 /DNA_END=1187 /DNA_ORIENTATION=+